MTTRAEAITRVLNRLRQHLGTGEKPPGSNRNFITEWYNANVDKIGHGPWCEMTITWAMWTGGAKELKKGRAYTVWAAGDAVDKVNGSSWHWGTKGMRAGDQVYFDWKGGRGKTSIVDHTGMVEKINSDGTFYILEGNNSRNKLERMRRDKRFIVGYTRFDWDKLVDEKPAPETPKPNKNRSDADPELVKRVQRLLKMTEVDGKWGKDTDEVATLMRSAARATVGWPTRVAATYNKRTVQSIVGTTSDGVWGPRSQASTSMWVKRLQGVLGLTTDGEWGPKTDNKFLTVRKNNLNNF